MCRHSSRGQGAGQGRPHPRPMAARPTDPMDTSLILSTRYGCPYSDPNPNPNRLPYQVPIVYRPEYNISFLGLERLHPFDSQKVPHNQTQVRACALQYAETCVLQYARAIGFLTAENIIKAVMR